ncbi:hypothetical protein SADUNF_Sadunf14G0056500 [Salix dunnii]|uniref:Uncharacterized protein n=1 Tax=Salix dunnii TaxID=1413687 RepID=A0A835MTF3_9ROSI|nr:hypothetical protein SADUNF_Sadunf14G0056500 [Salix dunnii]
MDSHKNSPASHFLAAIYGSRSYIISIIDMAQLFSKQGGARASKITTPVNATHVSKLLKRTKKVDILTIKFPLSDWFFPCSTDVASNCRIPEFVFHGPRFFSSYAIECVRFMGLTRSYHLTDPFCHLKFSKRIKLTRQQLLDYVETHDLSKMYIDIKESEIKRNEVHVNSFYKFESGCADHYGKALGRKQWHTGLFRFWNCDT